MKLVKCVSLGIAVAAVCAFTPSAQSATAAPKWVSGFYVGYMAARYPPSAIDFSALTHVMVFSVLPQRDGTLVTDLFVDRVEGPKIAQQVATLAHAAGRKAILTVGGEGTEAGFKGATTSENMTAFVRNLTNTVSSWGFDGVDIDWEPLPPSDYASVLSLVTRLKAARPGILVTVDVGWQSPNFPLNAIDSRYYAQLAGLVDQMNMMTYGMADDWGGWVVWHSSALFGEGPDHPSSVVSSAHEYLAAGVPAAKLGMGIGFYGSCWIAPAAAPLQRPAGSHVMASDNEISFANVRTTYSRSGTYHFDETAQAPYLSFATPTGPSKCTFVSYEDEASVAAKGHYAHAAGLGGTIIWQLNEGYVPDAADPSALLHAVGRAFVVPAATNHRPTPPRPGRAPWRRE